MNEIQEVFLEAAKVAIILATSIAINAVINKNRKSRKTTEYILCAAIWYKQLPTVIHNPVNIDIGVVICGRRHHNVISVVHAISRLRTVHVSEDATGEYVEGFVTSNNRFVDRTEAAQIAKKAGQVERVGRELYSEDLY